MSEEEVPRHISRVVPDLTESTEAQAERLEDPGEGSECLFAKRRDSSAICSQKSFLKSQPSLGPQLPELLLPGGATHAGSQLWPHRTGRLHSVSDRPALPRLRKGFLPLAHPDHFRKLGAINSSNQFLI